jgi:hypothetical protein
LPDSLSDADAAQFERESEQAWSGLEAGFMHEPRFSKEFLSDQTEGAAERIVNKLVEWTDDIPWPDGSDSGMWKATAGTADECCEKTSLFMQDRFWPFTKIIRSVFIKYSFQFV